MCFVVSASPATAATIYVPSDDYSSIRAAVDAAANGDEIEVVPGTYDEAINFLGKAIRLYSSGGPDVTTIDASRLDSSVVTSNGGENANTILEGFTITGGNANGTSYPDDRGGGMNNSGSSPRVVNYKFADNKAKVGGEGRS